MIPFCPRCGSLLPPRSNSCSSCGWKEGDSEDYPDVPVVKQEQKILREENPELPFFPYEPRDMQTDIVKDLTDALDQGRHIVIESGTGTGKTIVSLSSALAHAVPRKKKVLYITRTITQSDQVMKELRAISKLRPVSGITITGRRRSCPFLKTLPDYENIPPSVLSNICEMEKKKANDGKGGCKYYAGAKYRMDDIENFCKKNIPVSADLDSYCERVGACPYEAKKMIIRDIDVIVAPYVHVLSESIRDNFLGNMESDGSNMVMIVDEAHNIVDAARQQESFTITDRLIDTAKDEVTTMRQDPRVFDTITLGEFIGEIKRMMKSTADEKLSIDTKEALVASDDLTMRVHDRFDLNMEQLSIVIENMIQYGEERTERLMENGENRISEVYTLGDLLRKWFLAKDDKYIKSVAADENGESLHAACIDPFDVIQFIRSIKGVIHMSGTLRPVDQYVKVMGLPKDTVTNVYPSPFPPENKSVIYVDSVTTRYQEMKSDLSMKTRIRRYIIKLCNSVEKNTLVFFPSYHLMNEMKPFLEHYIEKDTYWEEQKNPRRTAEALLKFRKGRNGVFFTVMGGSIAEGIDFPGEELCFSIIVGIPYPPPTLEMKGMSDMFDKRFGQGAGWRFTSEIPTIRKMQQAIGRMIRTETDRGMAVILDSRMSKYAKTFDAVLSKEPEADAVRFFDNNN